MKDTESLFDSNSYISFDATSISDLIIKRLNQNEIFTDQNYQGSNLSSLIDVISYSFSTLLYYLNKTSSESMFSEAQVYENMNRIVKLLNYNPKGKLSQTLSFTLDASLPNASYVLPRYSYVTIGNIQFSLTKDIYFAYLDDTTIQIQNPEVDLFMFQGKVNEYPIYSALGAANEVLFLNLGKDVYIDHYNIHVYVKSKNGTKWEQWQRTENLFLNRSSDKIYEVRYNPNKNYEIKFGDNINGKQLETGDSVLVYYLSIDPTSSTIAADSLRGKKVVSYNSLNFINVFRDTQQYPATVVTSSNLNNIYLNNQFPSTPYKDEESVEQIRKNAPKSFSYQQRLVTANDFETYIINNYSNIFADCKVVNNEDYLKGHIKYLYDIGIKSPQLSDSVLYNQIKFSNSCNFNNIYAYLAPLNGIQQYATSSQKEVILSDMQNQKLITCDIVPMDPVYMMFDFYVKAPTTPISTEDLNENYLYVYKKANTRQSDNGIINDIIQIFKNAFGPEYVNLGQLVDINKIASDIINLDSVEKIQTYRRDSDVFTDGLSMLVWNKSYPELDVSVHNFNLKLNYFQFPAFNDIDNLVNKIKIINSSGIISVTDY